MQTQGIVLWVAIRSTANILFHFSPSFSDVTKQMTKKVGLDGHAMKNVRGRTGDEAIPWKMAVFRTYLGAVASV